MFKPVGPFSYNAHNSTIARIEHGMHHSTKHISSVYVSYLAASKRSSSVSKYVLGLPTFHFCHSKKRELLERAIKRPNPCWSGRPVRPSRSKL